MEPFMICCPGCGTRFSVRTANALGQTRPCPKCAAPIEIVDPNAPLEPPRQSLPWNRWALAGGTAAAILVVVAVLVISRGGAAGSSPEPAEAVADAADVVPSEPDAAPASAPETGESQTEPAPEQPAQGQVTEPPIVDALAAEVQKLLAVEPGEPAEPKASEPKPADLQPTQPAAADTSRTSVPRRPPAAPSAAQRAKSALGSPQSPPEPAHDALLGPARKRAAGQSAAGGPHPPQPSTAGPPEGTQDPEPAAAKKGSDRAVAEKDDPVHQRLHRKIVLYECDQRPLDFLVEELSDLSALEVSLDYAALDRLRIEFDTPITLHLEDTNLAGILTAIVEPRELDYVVTGEKILITAPSKADAEEPADETP